MPPEPGLTIPRNLSVRQFVTNLWLIVLTDTYLSLLRVITGLTAGDTGQFKATLLILQRSSIGIGIELFMAIYQHQSQHHNHDEP
jgi:hypothetical protein